MAVQGLGRVGVFLLRGLGTLAGIEGLTVAYGTEPQGTAQLMCGARSLTDNEEYVGCLNVLAGTTGLGPVGALVLLGGTFDEVVGCVNELASTDGLELGAAMRAWAASGNF